MFGQTLTATEAFAALLRDLRAYDAALNDDEHDGAKAQSPTGDDYNALFEMIHQHAATAGIIGSE